ncbi:MAG: uracil-DNA glycosylase [Burkholderiales bacterium]
MSSRRDEILKEIGITPVWRLRVRESFAQPHEGSSKTAPTVAGVTVSQPPFEGTSHASQQTSEPSRIKAQPTALHGSSAPMLRRSLPDDDRCAAIIRMDWAELKHAVAQCVACALHARRNKTVFGVGDENADWMFVGEGPGADEDRQGDPFVGQAGKLLDSMLAAIRLKRGDNVYIANVVKCRPPGNRNPEPDEASKCEPFLQRQIELIKPKLIIALGRVAALNLLSREASIASLRGRVLAYRGTPLIVTYHPAYLLRNLPDKAKAWEDLCFAVKTMQDLQSQ